MSDFVPINLSNAIVAITGGARGIGLQAAKDFTAKGATVVIGDLDLAATQTAAKEIGPRALGLQLDVTDRDSFARFVATIESDIGEIDVFLNNAGIMPAGPFLAEGGAASDTQIDVNLRGPIHGMKLVLPLMIERKKGHVINVASMAGKAPIPGLAVYNATKFAVVGMSQAVRDEIEGTGVSITTIMPNAVKTELTSGLPTEKMGTLTPQKVSKAVVKSVQNRREEVAIPRYFALYPLMWSILPPRLLRAMRHKLGVYRLLDESRVDAETRAKYDERIAGSSSHGDAGAASSERKDSLVG